MVVVERRQGRLRRRKVRCVGERRGAGEEMEIFPYILRQSQPVRLCQKALFLERSLNGAFYAWLSTDTKKLRLLHI